MARHKHADLMIAYANDASLEIECKKDGWTEWFPISNPSFYDSTEYRIKPREFVVGEWYPCIDDVAEESVYMYHGNGRFGIDSKTATSNVDHMNFIVKSLGVLNFEN